MAWLDEDMVTYAEVAKRLGVSRRTIERQVKLGMAKHRVGRAVRFKPSEVEAWFAAHDVPHSHSLVLEEFVVHGRSLADTLDVLGSREARVVHDFIAAGGDRGA